MKILVTGGTGFIGRHLVGALARSGHEVSTISRRGAPSGDGALHHPCDVESPEAQSLASNAQAVVHLAGQPDASASLADPAFFARVNSSGCLNMLEAARRADALFVLASSQRVYRPKSGSLSEEDILDPSDPYGYSKLVAEKWVEMYRKVYRLRSIVLRFFSVYGPGQAVGAGASGVVSIFMDRALAGKKLTVNNRNLRDFTYVTDVVKGIQHCLNNPEAIGETFNVATGSGTCVKDLATLIKEITRSRSEIELVGESTEECYVANIRKIGQALGYQPDVGLREGLECYYENVRIGSRDTVESPPDGRAIG